MTKMPNRPLSQAVLPTMDALARGESPRNRPASSDPVTRLAFIVQAFLAARGYAPRPFSLPIINHGQRQNVQETDTDYWAPAE